MSLATWTNPAHRPLEQRLADRRYCDCGMCKTECPQDMGGHATPGIWLREHLRECEKRRAWSRRRATNLRPPPLRLARMGSEERADEMEQNEARRDGRGPTGEVL